MEENNIAKEKHVDVEATAEQLSKQLAKKKGLVLDINERPKSIGQWILLALQHVFAMFGSTVLVPLVINASAGSEVINTSMALFCSGIGTLIYILLTWAKVPMYLGSSFSYMGALAACYPIYHNAVFIAIIIAGFLYCFIGLIIYLTGNNFIEKILPKVVIGPLIMVIGLTVAPSAIGNSGFIADPGVANGWKLGYSHWIGIAIALFTFAVIALVALKFKGFMRLTPILIGVVAGYVLALILHFAINGGNNDIVDTSKITNTANWEWYPSFKAIWKVDVNNIGPAILAISPLCIIAMAEHVGEHINLGQIAHRNFLKNPGLHRTLMADGVSIMIDGLIGGPANTTYGENTSVIGMTKIASVWVIGLAAIFAIILSFIAPVNQIVQMMPTPVIGGVSIVLFGFITINGIKILINNNVNYDNMRNILITGFMLVIGIGGAVLSFTLGEKGKLEFSGLALSAFAGIILNLVLPRKLNNGFHLMYLWNLAKKLFTKNKR